MRDSLGGKWLQEAGINLSGDIVAARQHIGVGRALLGHLRDRQIHGGPESLTTRKVMPDGTVIDADLVMGTARVAIYSPAKEPKEPSPEGYGIAYMPCGYDSGLNAWALWGAPFDSSPSRAAKQAASKTVRPFVLTDGKKDYVYPEYEAALNLSNTLPPGTGYNAEPELFYGTIDFVYRDKFVLSFECYDNNRYNPSQTTSSAMSAMKAAGRSFTRLNVFCNGRVIADLGAKETSPVRTEVVGVGVVSNRLVVVVSSARLASPYTITDRVYVSSAAITNLDTQYFTSFVVKVTRVHTAGVSASNYTSPRYLFSADGTKAVAMAFGKSAPEPSAYIKSPCIIRIALPVDENGNVGAGSFAYDNTNYPGYVGGSGGDGVSYSGNYLCGIDFVGNDEAILYSSVNYNTSHASNPGECGYTDSYNGSSSSTVYLHTASDGITKEIATGLGSYSGSRSASGHITETGFCCITSTVANSSGSYSWPYILFADLRYNCLLIDRKTGSRVYSYSFSWNGCESVAVDGSGSSSDAQSLNHSVSDESNKIVYTTAWAETASSSFSTGGHVKPPTSTPGSVGVPLALGVCAPDSAMAFYAETQGYITQGADLTFMFVDPAGGGHVFEHIAAVRFDGAYSSPSLLKPRLGTLVNSQYGESVGIFGVVKK